MPTPVTLPRYVSVCTHCGQEFPTGLFLTPIRECPTDHPTHVTRTGN